MQPITKKGKPPNMPTPLYSSGSKAPAKRAITATNTKLIHHGERNSTANNDFSDILNFTRTPCRSTSGPIGRPNHYQTGWSPAKVMRCITRRKPW